MPSITGASQSSQVVAGPRPTVATGTPAGVVVRQPVSPFSVIVLAAQDSPATAELDAVLSAAGATDIWYATSPADLIRHVPIPAETGIGIICRSPRADAVLQLIRQLRQRGWRRLLIAFEEGDEGAVRMAIAAKVRCLVQRPAPGLSRWLVASAGQGAAALQNLSPREIQVLQAVADGHTNNQIGDLLGLSGLTVKSHLARIGRKTGTGDRAQMVAQAMRAGVVR